MGPVVRPLLRQLNNHLLNPLLEQAYKADLIVRICGDCPLIDPSIADLVGEPSPRQKKKQNELK